MSDLVTALARDLWATGLQSNDDQARALVEMGWRKQEAPDALPSEEKNQ